MPAAGASLCQDENYAFIESLLDTLQDEGASAYESDGEDLHVLSSPGGGNPASPCAREIDADLYSALDCSSVVAVAGVHAESARSERRKWDGLLTRFCEDGDENVLDTLLDSFLTSKSDAAMLVEALGDAVPRKQHGYHGPRFARDAQLHLALDKLDNLAMADLESPSQNVWDALLDSARGLLQRGRTPLASPCSRKALSPSAAESLHGARGAASAREPSSRGGLSEASESWEPDGGACDALPSELRSPTSRAEFLSRIAEMDEANHEVARAFMRRFFLGVRSRLVAAMASTPDAGDADDSLAEGAEEESSVVESAESNAVTELSVWSCQSFEHS